MVIESRCFTNWSYAFLRPKTKKSVMLEKENQENKRVPQFTDYAHNNPERITAL